MFPPTKWKLSPWAQNQASPCPAACTPEVLKEKFLVLLLRFLSNRQRLYALCVKGSWEKIRKASSHQRVTHRERGSPVTRQSRSSGLTPTGWAQASNGWVLAYNSGTPRTWSIFKVWAIPDTPREPKNLQYSAIILLHSTWTHEQKGRRGVIQEVWD